MGFPVCADITSFGAFFTGWQSVITTATLIVILIAALAYILAGVVNHRGLRIWSQTQIFEAFATLMLAIFFIGIITFLCSLNVQVFGSDIKCVPNDLSNGGEWSIDRVLLGTSSAIAGVTPGSCNAFDVASYNLQIFREQINSLFIRLTIIAFTVAAFASTTWFTGAGGLGVSVSLGHIFSGVTQQMNMAMMLVTTAYILTVAQVALLQIAREMFGYLMIAGLLLRSFGFTRGFGGALIALAIGFYVVYPLMTSLFYGVLLDRMASDLQGLDQKFHAQECTQGWALCGLQAIGGSLAGGFGDLLGWIAGPIALVAVGAIVIPFLTFIVVISFTKALSGMLGEEIDVSNLTRLI